MGTDRGVVKAWAIRRMADGQQEDGDMVRNIKGSPINWKLDANEDRQLVEMEDRNDPTLNPDLEGSVGRRTGEKRSLYLSRRDFEVHGYTDGCRGCLDLASGKPRAGSFLSPHSSACRRRMEEAIKVTDPARWGRWLLRRGQEEIDREGITQPSGDT